MAHVKKARSLSLHRALGVKVCNAVPGFAVFGDGLCAIFEVSNDILCFVMPS